MRSLLKIGEFSRLARVTVKTLHLYDRLGLLPPAQVDLDTGYRLYSLDQLPRLNHILVLKDQGFSLGEVGHLLDEEPSPEEMQRILRRKRHELEQQMKLVQEQLVHVDVRLQHVERAGLTALYDVTLKQVEPITVASVRGMEPTVMSMVNRTYEITDLVRSSRVKVVGPTLALFYHEGFREFDLDVELAVPIASTGAMDIPTSSGKHVRVRELKEPVRVASLLWQGDGPPLNETYAAIESWIQANGYRVSGQRREIYLRDGPPRQKVFEIQYPIRVSTTASLHCTQTP